MVERTRTRKPSGGELPLTPVSLGSTTANRTGSWKYMEPYFEDRTPPCSERCPLQNDIATIMRFSEDGNFEGGIRDLLRHNPFPATLGRVCSRPCEQPCNRKAAGGAVRIQGVERFLGDYAIAHDIRPRLSEARRTPVAVVGAGPAGLSAAYFLRLLGHDVTVYEKRRHLGGQLTREIPQFRVSLDVLGQELDRLYDLGIHFELDQAVGRGLSVSHLRSKYAGVVLAVGRERPRALGVPGDDHPAVVFGADLLETLNWTESIDLGQRMLIVGGGRLALDCARFLRRLGKAVRVLYQRSRSEMPAPRAWVSETLAEGIPIDFDTAPVRILSEEGALVGVECARTERGVGLVPGSEFVLHADAVVTALGSDLLDEDLGGEVATNGSVIVDARFRTGTPGVYACGECALDALPAGDTIAAAIASGRSAASAVHEDLEGVSVQLDPLRKRGTSSEVAKFKSFARAYLCVEEPVALTVWDPEVRVHYVAEYVESLSEGDVLVEAARCIKCGTCTACDNCQLFCPDAAILRRADGAGYEILSDYCKGCGVCVEECPRGAIHLRLVDCRPGERAIRGVQT